MVTKEQATAYATAVEGGRFELRIGNDIRAYLQTGYYGRSRIVVRRRGGGRYEYNVGLLAKMLVDRCQPNELRLVGRGEDPRPHRRGEFVAHDLHSPLGL